MEKYRFTKPLDMPRGTHYGNNYWIFKSRKLGRRVTAFSNLEYENLITLEMNPEVEYYCEQPTEISICEEGDIKRAIPDVWVLYRDGHEEFQEVKYSDSLKENDENNKRNLEQTRREKLWAEQNNFGFCIRTESEIHRNGEYYLRNLVFLYGHAGRKMKVSKSQKNTITDILKNDSYSIREISLHGKMSHNETMIALSEMYYSGAIAFDDIINKPIRFETEVSLYGKKNI